MTREPGTSSEKDVSSVTGYSHKKQINKQTGPHLVLII